MNRRTISKALAIAIFFAASAASALPIGGGSVWQCSAYNIDTMTYEGGLVGTFADACQSVYSRTYESEGQRIYCSNGGDWVDTGARVGGGGSYHCPSIIE